MRATTMTRHAALGVVLLLGLALVGCPPPPSREASIHTDVHGVPHVYADTEEEVAYGLGYAMGRDQLATIVTLYRTANGTRAAREGAGSGNSNVVSDYLVNVFRLPQSAAAAYAAMGAQEKSWVDGFAAGLNKYIQEYNLAHNPDVETFSGTDVLAWTLYIQQSRQLSMAQGDLAGEVSVTYLAGLLPPDDSTASNQWVVGPARTGGPAMVLADPHLPWSGGNQWYESHLKNTAGALNVTGAGILGTPLVAMGRNEHVAWSMTSNGMLDFADCYKERLAVPEDYSAYRYDPAPGGTKPIVQEMITIQIQGQAPITAPAYYTHHGPLMPLGVQNNQPVFSQDGEHVYSMALSMMDGTEDSYPGDLIGGMLLQMYRFDTAQSLQDVKLALGLQGDPGSYPPDESLQMVKWNIVVGDAAGDIFYIYNGRCPWRDAHDEDPTYWDRPRVGWTGDDEWYREADGRVRNWSFAELPRSENPPSGILANCNVSPWNVGPDSGIDPDDYPPYLAVEGNTERNIRARELLEGDPAVTEEEMRLYSRDTRLLRADHLELLFFSFFSSTTYPDLETAADLLAAEPNFATKDNTSVALLFAWASELGSDYGALPADPSGLTPAQKDLLVATLRAARDTLEACPFGLAPAWGDVHYLDRGGIFPAGGGENPMASLFMVGGDTSGCSPIVGSSGSSYMMVSVLEPGAATSRSVRPLGASDDPSSPHYNDETARFVEDDPELAYKPNPFTDSEVTSAYLESTTVLTW